jgi:hypothetical protein
LNVRFDSLRAQIDTFHLGVLTFDPVLGEFYIRKTQDDFPDRSLFSFRLDTIFVRAVDDSGASDSRYVIFQDPLTNPPVALVHPLTFDDPVHTVNPLLGWGLWSAPDTNHTFGVTVTFQELYTAWDTSGLSASDTTVIVTKNLLSTSDDQNVWYSWHVTVTDDRGNRLASEPGYFQVFTTGTPALKHEPNLAE